MDFLPRSSSEVSLFLIFVGSVIVLSNVMKFIQGVYARLLRPAKNLRKAGKWAVVTGATDGIGLAMAEEFLRKGLSVLLISRSPEKLEQCSQDLTAKCTKDGSKVKTLDIDYSKFDERARARVKKSLEELDADEGIAVLVNNVGISYPFTKYFDELDDERVAQLMSLNVDSTTWMSRLVLPLMLTKKRGNIVNISSAAGVSTSPLLAQYGAAKSYIAMFSRALNYELNDKGVHVQCQVPMFVATKLAKIKKSSLFVPSPSSYAKAAVRAIGYEVLVSPFWSHAIQIWALMNFPEWIVARLTKNMHLDIRRRGMKKEQQTTSLKEGKAE